MVASVKHRLGSLRGRRSVSARGSQPQNNDDETQFELMNCSIDIDENYNIAYENAV